MTNKLKQKQEVLIWFVLEKKKQHFITNSRNGFCHMHVRHPTAKQEINNISQTVNLVPSYAILTRVTLINRSVLIY